MFSLFLGQFAWLGWAMDKALRMGLEGLLQNSLALLEHEIGSATMDSG